MALSVSNKANDSFYIKNPFVKIHDYQLNFQPYNYHWNLNARFEILGNFQLPPNTLKVDFTFPNQKSANNFLKVSHESCTNYQGDDQCQVYKTSTIISLSADKGLSRDMTNETISGTMNYDFSTTNAEIIKTGNKTSDHNYFGFIANWTNLTNWFSFQYSNRYKINYDSSRFQLQRKLSVVKKWTVNKNGFVNYDRAEINFLFPDYSYVLNNPIKKFFEIKIDPKEKYDIKYVRNYVDYYLNNKENKVEINELWSTWTKEKNKSMSMNFSGSTSFNGSTNELIIGGNKVKGIFIPKKTSGTLQSEILLSLNGNAMKINLINRLNFTKNFLLNSNSKGLIRINKLNIRQFEPGKFQEVDF